jgi:hypothetical protein
MPRPTVEAARAEPRANQRTTPTTNAISVVHGTWHEMAAVKRRRKINFAAKTSFAAKLPGMDGRDLGAAIA